MLLSEEEVYNGAKRWLRKNGFTVLAGQPARGVDHLPVIEIKQPTGDKGSKDAYKPDLVAYKDGCFYIVECKPGFDNGDLEKVQEVLSSPVRIQRFYDELEQYQLLKRVAYAEPVEVFAQSVKGVLAYSGAVHMDCPLGQLIVQNWKGLATFVEC